MKTVLTKNASLILYAPQARTAELRFAKQGRGWGVALLERGRESWRQLRPAWAEFEIGGELQETAVAYDRVEILSAHAARADARLAPTPEIELHFSDLWTGENDHWRLSRSVRVVRGSTGSFLTGCWLASAEPLAWEDARTFLPGMLYGDARDITSTAIGGRANTAGGVTQVRVREDRLPAPLVGVLGRSALTVMHDAPTGRTTLADAEDTAARRTMADERFAFAALGVRYGQPELEVGATFPGTEGEVTYQGDVYPGGQMRRWRRRHHPLRAGFSHHYQLLWRTTSPARMPEFIRTSWRWAWTQLRPACRPVDLAAARRVLVEALGTQVWQRDGRAGLPMWRDSVAPETRAPMMDAHMGWIGRSIESAYFLLADEGRKASRHQRLGRAVLDTFTRLKMNPPAGEGFSYLTGEQSCHYKNQACLRSLVEGGRYWLRAWALEHTRGHERAAWRERAIELAEWLATQEFTTGGFPIAWDTRTGKPIQRIDSHHIDTLAESDLHDPARLAQGQPSYVTIPFFLEVAKVTGDAGWIERAERTADFCWRKHHRHGRFVGGTLDNPNVVDKEAGTLSLDAYLRLFEATNAPRYLEHACAAADYAETWIYAWDVGMPDDAPDEALAWKRGVGTVGLQLISTGHSLVDTYMAFDAGNYARLHQLTGDPHYRDVAQILLHNTKAMLALPGRTFDLRAPGWQQEHWSLAPRRGHGIHRGWLPWVTVSHLVGLEDYARVDPGSVG